jgi:hypothetical protein
MIKGDLALCQVLEDTCKLMNITPCCQHECHTHPTLVTSSDHHI